MLPEQTKDNNEPKDHLKVYNEKDLNKKKPVFKWQCSICKTKGTDKETNFIYKYKDIKDMLEHKKED